MTLALLIVACGFAAPQDETPAKPQADVAETESLYEDRPGADPNGIDRYYMGRQIAQVMGHQGATWLERPNRQEEEDLATLVKLLKLKPGMVVADIGTGSGVIAQRIAPKIAGPPQGEEDAPGGVVKAVDIQPEMLARLKARMRAIGIENVEPVLSEPTDPKLEEGTIDVAVMVDVYHEFDDPHAMTAALAKSLKPGGRLVWVEYRKEDPRVPIKEIHKMSEAQVKKEASRPEFGLEYVGTATDLPRQHVITFRKPAATEAKPTAE
ncbi:class I SAM-dependent methyltransferase [Alienimonas chondri]|uniref:Ubiquinone/menaquinone biosynthesis C-methyltransferase UbiE n=1 Tax=Alienimonas chondri TaxID=2681879 RepID=A0ABX1VFT3_9PLAN|nr:methyltransferase [Alienimonas chondri]NNJ26968.1 Ubiquinone/menaquinone biosynthesis C-methyltransferase UbiE [Alienimonas chondri]